jgi:hypothetical protein
MYAIKLIGNTNRTSVEARAMRRIYRLVFSPPPCDLRSSLKVERLLRNDMMVKTLGSLDLELVNSNGRFLPEKMIEIVEMIHGHGRIST